PRRSSDLAQQTQYVLLDEPTSFLDISHQIEVLRLCRQITANGRTVLAVLHDLNQAARYADQLVVMHRGSIVAQGAPHDILTTELITDVCGMESMIGSDPWSGTPMVVPVTDKSGIRDVSSRPLRNECFPGSRVRRH